MTPRQVRFASIARLPIHAVKPPPPRLPQSASLHHWSVLSSWTLAFDDAILPPYLWLTSHLVFCSLTPLPAPPYLSPSFAPLSGSDSTLLSPSRSGKLLISRSDYSIRVLEPSSGKERWNASLGQFSLDFLPSPEAHPTSSPESSTRLQVLEGNALCAAPAYDRYDHYPSASCLWSRSFSSPLVLLYHIDRSSGVKQQEMLLPHTIGSGLCQLPPLPSHSSHQSFYTRCPRLHTSLPLSSSPSPSRLPSRIAQLLTTVRLSCSPRTGASLLPSPSTPHLSLHSPFPFICTPRLPSPPLHSSTSSRASPPPAPPTQQAHFSTSPLQ